MARVRSAVFLVGLATLGGWVVLWSYVAATNRWGIFAVAPALLPLLVASAGVAAFGSAIWVQGARRGQWDVPLMLVVAAHGAILFYASTTK